MFRCLNKRIPLGVVYLLVFSASLSAAPSNDEWRKWLQSQIENHPQVIAAKEQMRSANSLATNQELPLYNPELETEFEREGDSNNYSIGISQTIDWWDKSSVLKKQASISREAARFDFDAILQQRTAETISALIVWDSANQRAKLAKEQENRLSALLEVIAERQKAGDLGQLDAELTYLELSQQLNETAESHVQFRQAEAKLRELLPEWTLEWSNVPKSFWRFDAYNSFNQSIDQIPNVAAARAAWESLRQEAEVARLNAKTDPTFGLNAGKSEDDDVVGISFSMPLNIRNNFSAQVKAVNQQALSAESQYLAARRSQQFFIEAAQAAMEEYKNHYKRWQDLMKGRIERSANLLERQWRSGDVSTSEYLLSLQQRADGIVAGIELQKKYRVAYTDWLLSTGQLTTALKQVN